jgi:hypothetical protein
MTKDTVRKTEYDAGVARILYRRFNLGEPHCSDANFTIDVLSGVNVASEVFEAPAISLL